MYVRNLNPYHSPAELNFKKLNLIIGKNGVGKTRLFRIINQSLNLPKFHTHKTPKTHMSIYDENDTIIMIGLNPTTPGFSLMSDTSISYYYVPDKRTPFNSYVENAKQEIQQLEQHLFSNYLFNPDNMAFTNKMCQKIFNRTLDVRKKAFSNTTVDQFSYKTKSKLVDPANDGFGILQSLGVFQVLFHAKENSTVVIENPTAYLHPNAAIQVLDEIISYANTKNIQLIIITHDIITALRFFHKIKDDDKDTTIHGFEQIDDATHIHNVDKDSYIPSLADFLGKFPEKGDIDLLRDIVSSESNQN